MIAGSVRLGLIATLLLVMGAAPSLAQTAPPAVGAKVTNRVTIAGKHVPLPPGTWDVAVSAAGEIDLSADDRKKPDPAALGPILRLVLVQYEANRLRGMIEIHANGIPRSDGWGTAAECLRDDLYAAVTRYESGWDVSCLFVAPAAIVVAAKPDATVWGPVGEHAIARKAELPSFWLVAGIRVSNRHDFIDARYHFAPTALGVPAQAADAAKWAPRAIPEDPQRLELVKDVAAWTTVMQKFAEQGLQNRLGAGPFPAPRTPAVAAVPTDRADRIAALKKLLDDRVIEKAEHDRQLALIEGETKPKDLSTWTLSQVAAWKAGTYRVIVTTINAGIDYIYIGQPFAAGVLVILQVVVNTTKFFFHEMMWQEWLGVAPIQREVLPVLRFKQAVPGLLAAHRGTTFVDGGSAGPLTLASAFTRKARP